ncbi:MAG: CHAT domain-containing tetratricopeptide repeat protein [Pyrinomonadaceae bacterium]
MGRHATQTQSTLPSQSPEVTTLQPGQPVEGELAGGQKHVYQVALAPGQYASLTVDQRGIDVVARLFAADGQVLADIDSERTSGGTETIELVADAAGNYKIEIAPVIPKAAAGRYTIRVSEVRVATADEKRLHDARRQFYESLRLAAAGKFSQALEPANRALEIREKVLGPGHPDVAASLRAVGNVYLRKDDLAQAEVLLQRALEATAKTSGIEALAYADVLHSLALLRFSRNEYPQSDQLNKQALAIREKVMGPESLPVALSLINMGLLYRVTSDLPQAEQMYLRVLAIREKLLGADHLDVSLLQTNLGFLYYTIGDYASAEPLLLRSLAIKEKALDPNHPLIAATVNNLGLLEWKKGDYQKAESYFTRTLNIAEKASGPDSDAAANALHNLGIVYKETGNYAKGEEYYQRALAMWEKVWGKESIRVSVALSSLGILYRAKGDYDRAETFHLRELEIVEKALGPNHPDTASALNRLARLYAEKGDITRSVEYQKRVEAIEEKNISWGLGMGSERQKIAFFTTLLQKPDRIVSLHLRLARDNGDARDLAAATVLGRKGRILDALSNNLSGLRQRFSAKDQKLIDQLNDVNSRLSRLVIGGRQKMTVADHESQVHALEREAERLESEVSRSSQGFYQSSQLVTLGAVRQVIPGDAALVEFVVYRPFDTKAIDNKTAYGEPRYAVYVIRNQGEVRWAELGTATDIDRLIDSLRQALGNSHSKDVQSRARAVDEKVMRPVRLLVGDARQLLISPDGALNLIPFEALVDERDRYLVQRYAFTYLTSGRDLLRMQVPRAGAGRPIVVANPSFGEPAPEQIARVNATSKPAASNLRRRSVTAARDLSEVYFAPLSGTAREANTIHSLFPEAELLTGDAATESALKAVAAPRLLHIATHGFFLEDAGTAAVPAAGRGAGSIPRIENPLLRSGLAMAGANLGGDSAKQDGILTALEASGLNLWGTKLVVLSACDTGLGEVKNGEGVYGLRRAFVLAGAESLVMSLWPISDYSTRTLMTNYYRNLKLGMGRGPALRQVQLDLLKRNKELHPFYWANFIQSGEWANLEGRR